MRQTLACTILALLMAPLPAAELNDVIKAPGDILVTTTRAVGAQIYECEFDTAERLIWQFREPIAALFAAGKTVGRHYVGPSWELIDGSVITGKVVASAPAASPNDIPLLTSRRGQGQLTLVTTIKRINTRGGVAAGPCNAHHALLSVPYTADYAFYQKRGAVDGTAGE
jgi:Protein of unknown function (DUF3455)